MKTAPIYDRHDPLPDCKTDLLTEYPYICPICFLAQDNTNRRFLSLAAVIIVENAEVAAQLGKICNLDVVALQLKHNRTAKVTIIEKKVYPVVVTQFVKVYLVSRGFYLFNSNFLYICAIVWRRLHGRNKESC